MPALSRELTDQLREEKAYYKSFSELKSLPNELSFPYVIYRLCTECPIHEPMYECCKNQEKFWETDKLFVVKRYAKKMVEKIESIVG